MRAPVSPGERLAATLRYLTTGDSMQTISFSYHLGHSTMCNIVKDTCRELWNALSGTYLHTVDEWKRISDGFIINGISQTVLGQLMGNIVLQAPSNSGSLFYNYKGTHSIVLLAACDADYCFTLLDIGNYGRMSDGGVFANSSFGDAMMNDKLSLPDSDYILNTNHTTYGKLPYYFVADKCVSTKNISFKTISWYWSTRR